MKRPRPRRGAADRFIRASRLPGAVLALLLVIAAVAGGADFGHATQAEQRPALLAAQGTTDAPRPEGAGQEAENGQAKRAAPPSGQAVRVETDRNEAGDGPNLGQEPARQSGSAVGQKTSEQASGQTSARTPGQPSGPSSGQTPSQPSGQASGQPSGQPSGQTPNKSPARNAPKASAAQAPSQAGAQPGQAQPGAAGTPARPDQKAAAAAPAKPFSFDDVVELARKTSAEPYQPPKPLPDFLQSMNYDAWRDIRFKKEAALWAGEKLPFTAEFFHPGLYYDRSVKISEVVEGQARPLGFSAERFTYGRNDFADKIPPDLGYAGFRLHYPLNRSDYYDEVAVFLGASYLRAVPKGMKYGLSVRGLAIDMAASKGEEFPWFRQFWLVRPKPKDRTLTLFALLDSESCAGAYRFVLAPGAETRLDSEVVLFMRRKVEKLGLAPLTSMFFYGENKNIRPVDDFRPETHDSDGLLAQFGSGEWMWRPLRNPQSLSLSVFSANNVKEFGLLQRDLDFASYQDLEALYHDRPSAWITPTGKWGEGRIELMEIPTPNEFNDNVIASWVPNQPPEPGQPYRYSYVMSFRRPEGLAPGGQVAATRTSHGKDDRSRLFLIDFAGGKLGKLPPDRALQAVVGVDEKIARVVEQQIQRNPYDDGWRLSFQVRLEEAGTLEKVLPNRKPVVEMRAFLKDGDDVLTETWSYVWQP